MNVIVAPSIVGLAVQMPAPCRCGSRLATVAADHVLKCDCGARRGLLSSRTADFIKQIVGTFGPLNHPIILRRRPEYPIRIEGANAPGTDPALKLEDIHD